MEYIHIKIKEFEESNIELIIVSLFSCECDTELQKKKQLDFEIKILNDQRIQKTRYLTNIETFTKIFININFAKSYKLFLIILTKFFKLRLINETMNKNIIYVTRIILIFKKYFEELFCLITFLIKFDIIFDIL